MPMFQTFADYDKWRRRQLLMRLEALKPAPDSIVQVAAQAGDPSIRSSSRSPALRRGETPVPMKSAPISKGLQKGIISPSYFNGMVSPALRAILRQRILDFLATGDLPQRGETTGPGPAARTSGDDVVMAVTDGAFKTARGSQLTGLPVGAGTDNYCMSCFIEIPAEITTTQTIGDSGNRRETFQFQTTGALSVVGGDWLGGSYMADTTAIDILTPTRRAHLMVCASRADGSARVWIDGVAIVDEVYATANDPLGNENNWFICQDRFGSLPLGVDTKLGAYWIGNEFVADPVGVFIEAAEINPTPLVHGADGSTPTGTQPVVFFNEIADWNSGTNRGTGGDFTVAAGTMS